MSAHKSILLSVIATLSCGFAQSGAALPPAAVVASDSPAADAAIAPDKLQLAQVRLAHMQQIADRFSGEAVAPGFAANAWRFERVNHLMRADRATIERVEGAPDLRFALQMAAAPAAAGAQAKALEEASNDLIYVPIAPCRIVDTRNSGAGGNFGASESRTYSYTGGAA